MRQGSGLSDTEHFTTWSLVPIQTQINSACLFVVVVFLKKKEEKEETPKKA